MCIFSVWPVIQRHVSMISRTNFFSRNVIPYVLNMSTKSEAYTLSCSIFREVGVGRFQLYTTCIYVEVFVAFNYFEEVSEFLYLLMIEMSVVVEW